MFISGPPSQSSPYLGEIGRFQFNRPLPRETFGIVINANPPFKAPPGYAWEYTVDGLSGLGRFSLKKIVKRVVSVVKQVAKPLLAITAGTALLSTAASVLPQAVTTAIAVKNPGLTATTLIGAFAAAPWFSSLAGKIGTQSATDIITSSIPPGGLSTDQIISDSTSSVLPSWLNGPVQTLLANQAAGQAQAQAAQLANQQAIALQRQQEQAAANAAARGDTEISQRVPATASETPAWVLPAAIGGAALLLVTTMS